jgi:hypothetical protein
MAIGADDDLPPADQDFAASAPGGGGDGDNDAYPAPPPKKKFKAVPPKQKKGKLKHTKQSSFDYATANEVLGVNTSATPIEVTSAIIAERNGQLQSNPTPSSPLKEAVKQQNLMLIEKDEQRQKELDELLKLTSHTRGKIDEQEQELKNQKGPMKSLGVENKKLKKDSSKLKTLRQKHASDKIRLRDTIKTLRKEHASDKIKLRDTVKTIKSLKNIMRK